MKRPSGFYGEYPSNPGNGRIPNLSQKRDISADYRASAPSCQASPPPFPAKFSGPRAHLAFRRPSGSRLARSPDRGIASLSLLAGAHPSADWAMRRPPSPLTQARNAAAGTRGRPTSRAVGRTKRTPSLPGRTGSATPPFRRARTPQRLRALPAIARERIRKVGRGVRQARPWARRQRAGGVNARPSSVLTIWTRSPCRFRSCIAGPDVNRRGGMATRRDCVTIIPVGSSRC